VLGILMARIVMSGRWIEFGLAPAAGLMTAAFIGAHFVPWLYSLDSVTILPTALLIAAAAVTDARGATSLYRNRILVRLGELSFAFYMVHGVVLLEIRKVIGYARVYPVPGAIGATALAFAIALCSAWLLYECVEKPMVQRFGRTSLQRPEPRPLLASGPVIEAATPALAGRFNEQLTEGISVTA
jgi:peptidoglycan/LPS O-acetylase OafA/YrhL